jgi:nitrite reductase (NO-forming)
MGIRRPTLTFPRRVALLRIAFGLIWVIDAGFKWRPSFIDGFASDIRSAAQGQPGWILWWFHLWRHILAADPRAFAYATAVIETVLALCLLLGLVRAWAYLAGAVFGLVIWSVAEGSAASTPPGRATSGRRSSTASSFSPYTASTPLPVRPHGRSTL